MSDNIKFYTASGDDGTTGLLGKGRVKKYHPRPEAYGDVDEAQAALGVARAAMQDADAAEIVLGHGRTRIGGERTLRRLSGFEGDK